MPWNPYTPYAHACILSRKTNKKKSVINILLKERSNKETIVVMSDTHVMSSYCLLTKLQETNKMLISRYFNLFIVKTEQLGQEWD